MHRFSLLAMRTGRLDTVMGGYNTMLGEYLFGGGHAHVPPLAGALLIAH